MADARVTVPQLACCVLISLLPPVCCLADDASLEQQAAAILSAADIDGGLIVHLGCGDGRLTAELGRSSGMVVQGLTNVDAEVREARQHLSSGGLYGRVTVTRLHGGRLPYVDNMVNLLVVDRAHAVKRSEMLRVLAPLGVLLTRSSVGWDRYVNPWPEDIDSWTHFLHGPGNNAVAEDRVVGPPRHVQWLAGPRHLRSHEHLNSVSALVSDGGRIFYIIDEGPTASVIAPPRWRLVARDAFNGILLWKQEIGPWEGHFRLFRSGPPDIARRLVAVGDRVYATLGYGKPVAAFDASSGEVLRTYDETDGALEIVHSDSGLFVVTGTIDPAGYAASQRRYYPSPAPRDKGLVAVHPLSGELLWKLESEDTAEIMPSTLAAHGDRLFFQNTRQVICLDKETGEEQWRADRPVYTTRLSWSTPTLVACGDVVLSADGSTGGVPADVRRGEDRVDWIMSDTDIRTHPKGDLVALDAQTGETLWTSESLQGFCSPGDVFVIDGQVWAGALVSPGTQSLNVALNLRTGEIEQQRATIGCPVGGHTRCYRNKATERFLVLGGVGVEFTDVDDWSWTSDQWVRGTCQYGVMPCNGLLYVPPDSCACRPNVRLHGFTAMAPAASGSDEGPVTEAADRLQTGPSYQGVSDSSSTVDSLSIDDASDAWPTYRNDNARSGRTRSHVTADLQPLWQTKIGGQLTSLTIGDGRAYVSRVDTHTVYALDLESGQIAWSRTVGGPVDSPPTFSGNSVVFGCHDGWVYRLRAEDGQLEWRFRAAPTDRQLTVENRLESVWPVHGSVLVRDGQVWCAAGRSSYLDDGIYLVALDFDSGEVQRTNRLDGRNADAWPALTTKQYRSVRNRLPGTLPDVLSASDELLFMGWTVFDAEGKLTEQLQPHLFSATGFLDDTWWHRTYWQYGTWMRGGFGGWPQAARQTPAGRLLVFDEQTIYGFGRPKYDVGNPTGVHAGHVGVLKDGYQDSGHVDHQQNLPRLFAMAKPTADDANRRRNVALESRWQTSVPILVRGMLLADQTLFMAGPKSQADHGTLADVGTAQPGRLLAVGAEDGEILATRDLSATPVLDGMIAVAGRILISGTDGEVRCLGDRPRTVAKLPLGVGGTSPAAGGYSGRSPRASAQSLTKDCNSQLRQ